MAAERKENSVLFTLKELKDITADQPDPPPAAAPAPAKPKRPVSSFIDDAESLLADIRDSVDEEAAAEARRLEEQKRAAEDAERRRLEDEESRHKAEMEARMAAEEARRRAAADERAAKAAAIDRAERIARGEIVDEPEPVRPQVIQAQAPQAPPSRGTGFYLIVVGLPVLCLTAVAIALIMRPAEQPTIGVGALGAPTVAAAPAPAPMPVAALEEEEEDVGVPDAAPPDAEPKKVAAKKTGRKTGKKTAAATADDGDDGKAGKKKLNIKLGGDEGGITF